jgi:hypothetical protein
MEIDNALTSLDGLQDQHGRPLAWRDMRRNRAVLFAHAGTCFMCASYGRQLIGLGERFAQWDGDIWLVGGSVARLAKPVPDSHVRIAGDPAHRAHRRCHLPEQHAAVMVADRWGQIWQITVSDDNHALPNPDDLFATMQLIACNDRNAERSISQQATGA